jgi:hypothetical protein
MSQAFTYSNKAKPQGADATGVLLNQVKQLEQSGEHFLAATGTGLSSSSNIGMDLTHVPARPGLRTAPKIQCCAKDGGSCSCPKCQEAARENEGGGSGEEELQQSEAAPEQSAVDEAAPEQSEATPEAETSSSTESPGATSPGATAEASPTAEQSSVGLIVEDSATEVQTGQMKKTQFLQQLREGICNAIDPVLASAGRSSEGCPYLNYWLDMYQGKDAAHIEQAAKKYAPDTANARTAEEYISIIVQRASRAAEIWVATGKLTGVPEGVPTTIPGQPAPENAGQGSMVQAKAKRGGVRKTDDPHALQQELGEGQPLAGDVRGRMESAFGASFSHVRTHTDATAGAASGRVNARAFTVGNHIAFGRGEYQPGTMLGDALIAHELAHTMQQQGANQSVDKMEVGSGGYEALERDADQSAASVVSSMWGKVSGGLSNIRQNLIPRLRSGLRLSRCNDNKTPASPQATTTTQSLSKKNTKGPTAGNCGEYSWIIQWELDKPAGASGGFVVQTFNRQYDVKKCNNDVKDNSKYTYQEAWPINAGKKVSKWAETGDLNDDEYADASSGKGSKGTIATTGVAAYYDGLTLPSDFKENNKDTLARILPSTTTIHNFPDGSSPVQHDLTAEWDCCPDKTEKTKFTKQT